MERVRVHVRLRPATRIEASDPQYGKFLKVDERSHEIIARTEATNWCFRFDTVFGERSTQDEVYLRTTKGVVDSVLKGFNGCVMCYGQTGTGKTHTMSGKIITENGHHESQKGIIPASLAHIFDEIHPTHSVVLSYVQLYRDHIQDLLTGSLQVVQLREDARLGIYLSGVRECVMETAEESLSLLKYADKYRRSFASTAMNKMSSRAHTILMINVFQKDSPDNRLVSAGTLTLAPYPNSYYRKLWMVPSSPASSFLSISPDPSVRRSPTSLEPAWKKLDRSTPPSRLSVIASQPCRPA